MLGKLRYMSAADKWLRWDGTRWAWCACGEEMAAAKKVAAKILEQSSKLFASDPNRYKKLMAFATSLQNLTPASHDPNWRNPRTAWLSATWPNWIAIPGCSAFAMAW